MDMKKKEDKWRKSRSVKGTLEKTRFGGVECGKLLHYKNSQRHNTQT
ncbi:hypothetical protein T12_12780 [Trichinella patagoniensis]|uniref:Uncharacterized protein n=1 Tax=Trichinella patagoniensis TaxID=990121 RepID=A0A0V0Z0T3_9BILA|nr:hypothetical protein T12_12780 [Trichinella patagoniensis]